MDENLQMGHMGLADIQYTGIKYYLSHHVVFKSNNSTTKLRVVFDSSATTSSGLSLNDILLKSSKVQPDIVKILCCFRIHNIAITADVAYIYRKVLVSTYDCELCITNFVPC